MQFETLKIEVQSLFASDQLDSAKRLIAAFLKCQPDSLPAYKLLGDVYEQSGHASVAKECYLGRLTEEVQINDFALDIDRKVLVSNVVDSVLVHPVSEVNCQGIAAANHSSTKRYTELPLRSKPTSVITADSSRLWYDGVNTVLVDSDDQVYSPASTENVGPVLHAMGLTECQVHRGTIVLLGARGSNNYYHWLTDILPKLEVLRLSGFKVDTNTKYIFTNITQAFQSETLQALNIRPEQIIETWKTGKHLQADKIVVPCLTNDMGLSMGGWLPDFVNSIFLNSSDMQSSRNWNNKILVSRDPKASHGRGIENLAEFNQHYIDRGFELLVPDRLSIKDQAALFGSASDVVGPHGAGLTNILFCRPNTNVLEYFGDHFAPCYWAISQLCKYSYSNISCSKYDSSNASSMVQAKSLDTRRSKGFKIPLSNTMASTS